MNAVNQINLGIAIDGGALRCSYYLGVFQYIYEKEIIINEMVTVSSGTMAALIYFSGKIPQEIFGRFKQKLNPNKLKLKIFSTLLGDLINICYKEDKDVLSLNNKLKVLATDIKNLKTRAFSNFKDKNDLFYKCEASCSLPFFFNFPVKIENKYYIDGFISNAKMESYLNTKKILHLSAFLNKKAKNCEKNSYLFVKDKHTTKNILSTFYLNEKIADTWFENGYSDATNLFQSILGK